MPVLGSLNGVSPGGWTRYARQLADAGAAAIELNLYDVATDIDETGQQIERRQLEVVAAVISEVDVPVSVKLSPFYASVPSFVAELARVGAAGVVLFNRFYQPDIDLETLDVDRHLVLSTPAELPLRLHALAILHDRTAVSLAASGGVHAGTDAAKAILCGAHVVQVVSALLHGGVPRWSASWRISSSGSTRSATGTSQKPAAPPRWRTSRTPTSWSGSTTHTCCTAGSPAARSERHGLSGMV